jgi:catechol 2,3-dioxygenase-like lactoylglutathione lyase family enzyme
MANLTSISPFFIVKNLQTSIAYYRERLGFQLDFQGPSGDRPYYAGVSRDGIVVHRRGTVGVRRHAPELQCRFRMALPAEAR